MSASRAFDLALFVGTPANVNDASVVSGTGPPFVTAFKSVALSAKPGGVTVQTDVPAAVKQGQIMLSGAGPSFAWGLIDNPAAAASPCRLPRAPGQVVMADGIPSWQPTTRQRPCVVRRRLYAGDRRDFRRRRQTDFHHDGDADCVPRRRRPDAFSCSIILVSISASFKPAHTRITGRHTPSPPADSSSDPRRPDRSPPPARASRERCGSISPTSRSA